MFTTSELKQIEAVIRKAGELILEVYEHDFSVEYKQDESPLTVADQLANNHIVDSLSTLFPKINFITEETKTASYSNRKTWSKTWIVDPLDGTKEFVKRNGEFTVNIALCEGNEIVFGMILVPVTGDLYYAQKGEAAWKKNGTGERSKLQASKPTDELIVVASRSHRSSEVDDFVDQFSSQFKSVKYIAAGSSLKICLVAEGKAHLYPRLGPTMEWDTAAGQIIAEESGATMLQANTGEEMVYNKEDLLNPNFIVSSFTLTKF